MIHDLQGEANMAPVVGMLLSAVTENSQRLKSITEGMSQEEVDYKGENNRFNSTAQLIRHITFVDMNWVYRIKGAVLPQRLIEQYGPMIDENDRLPLVQGLARDTLISQYEGVLTLLKETCTHLADADLDRVVYFWTSERKASYDPLGIMAHG